MPGAYISIEDTPEGELAVKCGFEGGWNKDSHAHQHAQILLAHLDTLAERRSEPEVVNLDGEQAERSVIVSA